MSLDREPLPTYTKGEEILNSVTHGIGSLLAVVGTAVLIVWAVWRGNTWAVVSSAIYGFSLIVLYTMSTLYHAVTNETIKRVMRILDHSTIFLLIAGTYTPLSLVTLNHSPLGWVIFGLVWGSAVIGIVFNFISIARFKKVSMALYILSGWAIVIAMKPVLDAMAPAGLLLLFGGGVAYTGGIVFYAMKKRRWFHGIWHLCVLAGSLCHYFMILFYVV